MSRSVYPRHNVSICETRVCPGASQNCPDTGINFRFHAAPAQYETRRGRRIGRRPDVETVQSYEI